MHVLCALQELSGKQRQRPRSKRQAAQAGAKRTATGDSPDELSVPALKRQESTGQRPKFNRKRNNVRPL